MKILVKQSVTNRLTFNYIISLRMEINILDKLGYSNINEK